MMFPKRLFTSLDRFRKDTEAAIMTEAIVTIPVFTIFVIGVLEFGSLFWQREQIETGLRDAARYVARCPHEEAACQGVARNLAYHGSVSTNAVYRVPSWNNVASPIIFTEIGDEDRPIVTATTRHQLVNSPLLGFLGLENLTITANHDQRKIGW